ncbi:MAG: type II secretion system protein [bacterium]
MSQIKRKGFTLIEVIIALVIAGLISGVFAVVISQGMSAWTFLRNQRSYLMDARGALKRMEREIRHSSGDIIIFSPSEFEFVDIDNNTIDYRLSGQNLLRNEAVLLASLAGFEFTYLNASGEAAALASQIRVVQMSLVVSQGDNLVKMQTAAGIRNQ